MYTEIKKETIFTLEGKASATCIGLWLLNAH